jgi:hypothetical protein
MAAFSARRWTNGLINPFPSAAAHRISALAHLRPMLRVAVAVGVAVLTATSVVPSATSWGLTAKPVVLVKPGVAIGKVRLGMTIPQARQALGRPLVFEDVQRVPRDTLRLLRYRTKDGRWQVAFFGSPGRERLARVVSKAPGTRTAGGITLGMPISAVQARLRDYRPVCIQRHPFFNYVLHDLYVVACGVRTDGDTTVFDDGPPECAGPVIRYQGCQRLRITVGSVMVESDQLRLHKLSWWYPVVVIPPPLKTVPG